MGKVHELKTKEFSAKISAVADNIFKVCLGEYTEPKSGAILPQSELESELSEKDGSYIVSTGKYSFVVNGDGNFYACGKDGAPFARSYKKDGAEFEESYGRDRDDGKDGNEGNCGNVGEEKGYVKLGEGFELSLLLSENDHVFGLGEGNECEYGRLDRRGTVRDMTTGQQINKNRMTADFPIPFMLIGGGEKTYGIYLDNTYHLNVDLGLSVPDKLTVSAPGGACIFYLICGDEPADIVKDYSSLTGHAKLPPLWVLGFMQCKCSFWDWDEIDDAIEAFEERGVPLDSIVFDFDWAEYFNNYKWNPRFKGQSPEKIAYYREKLGLHFMASNSGPMLKDNSDTFASAVEAGILARDTSGKTVNCGHYCGELMDFTNPDIEEWLSPQVSNIMDDGVESWWLDLTEPEGDAPNTVYHAGPGAEIHNVFSNAVSKVYHSISEKHSPNKRSFILTRTGTAGIQRKPTALWSGDIYSEYGTFAAHVPEALNTQLSGISMWTCDTGGFLSSTNSASCPYNLYHNDRARHAHLYERWMQFSCFTPMFRAHHASSESVPYRFDEVSSNGMSHYIRLRYKLLPYVYSLYYENYLNGMPIMRPLFLHYPADLNAYSIKDEYFFGENLLVAPVLEEDKFTRKVYFPEGLWYDFDYDWEYTGGEHQVYAAQNRIPVFVKAGAIIPITKPIKNTREMDFSDVGLMIYPHGHSEFNMFADDGTSQNYEKGEYTKTRISCDETDDEIRVSVRQDNDKFPLRQLTLQIHVKAAAKHVFIGDQELGFVSRLAGLKKSEESVCWMDEFKRVLHVKLFVSGSENTVVVKTDLEKIYDRCLPPEMEEKFDASSFVCPTATILNGTPETERYLMRGENHEKRKNC